MKQLLEQILSNSQTFDQFKFELQFNGIDITDEEKLRESFNHEKRLDQLISIK